MIYWIFQVHHQIFFIYLTQDQVSYINCEHEDSVQRARRLSASREMILTDQADVASLLTQEDVMIYLRWLICHLHSVRPIQNFLRVIKHAFMFSMFACVLAFITLPKDLNSGDLFWCLFLVLIFCAKQILHLFLL